MDLRQTILSAMEARGLSRYALIQKLKGKRPGGRDVPAETIYGWLRGDSQIAADDLGLVLGALGAKVVIGDETNEIYRFRKPQANKKDK